MIEADSFQDTDTSLVPTMLPRELGIYEDPPISFLPDLPEYEAWK
jgi:hypothetical protein